MPKMRVMQVTQPKGHFELIEREIPEPAAGRGRIKVQACGICHSDSLVKERAFPGLKPFAPGQTAAADTSNGIEPAQTAEPQEVCVRSMQDGAVLKGEGRELGVSHEVSRRAKRLQQLEHLRHVIGPRLQNLHDRLCLPGADVLRGDS